MKIDDNGVYWFRQSWYGDFMLCPERARVSAFHPEMLDQTKDGTDATTLGTAAHKGIELFLSGNLDWDMACVEADEWLRKQVVEGTFRWVGSIQAKTMYRYLSICLQGWIDDVYPQVDAPDKDRGIEHTFRHQLTASIGIEGTWDYLDNYHTLWDWKTAGTNYSLRYGPKATARAHQPTFYSAALAGWQPGDVFTDLVWFKYGIMVKGKNPQGIVKTTSRGPADWAWMLKQLEAAVTMYEKVGPDETWPLHDNEWHCSEAWCENWFNCKGADDG